MSINEIQAQVNNLREFRSMAQELEEEITAIQDSIKAHMTAAHVDELTGTDYKITWKPVTSSRLDTAALRKAAPELVERFSKTTETRRFIVA